MPLTNPDALRRSLKSGKRGGVFFLYGEEEHLRDELASAIVDAHLDPGIRDFNFDQLRGTEVSPETLASVAATPPMMADCRVVLVRDAQALAANARMRGVVEDILDRKVPDLALIFAATLPTGPKAKLAQLFERMKKEAVAVEFPELSATDVPGWLIDRAHEEGFELDLDAARAMGAAIGAQLGILTQELKKLYELKRDQKQITLEDVRSAVGGIPRQDRWQWFDMLGEKRFTQARQALPILLDSGETGVGLIIGIGSQFLRLAIAAAGGERALQEVLPAYQRWLAGRLAKQAKAWRVEELENALDDLLRADRLLKSTNLGDLAILEEFILRLQTRAQTN